jgi:hypothetical protein
MIRRLRDEALLILEGRGAILEVAREVSRALAEAGIDGAVIGGVAVVLHGYVRTTADVDVLTAGPLAAVADALKGAGFHFDRRRGEFRKAGVPVHLVTADQTRIVPSEFEEIDGVRTVSLVDLITIKLSAGLRDPLRAIDLADVIGLIRAHRLSPAFAARLHSSVRLEFRKLARAVARETP